MKLPGSLVLQQRKCQASTRSSPWAGPSLLQQMRESVRENISEMAENGSSQVEGSGHTWHASGRFGSQHLVPAFSLLLP